MKEEKKGKIMEAAIHCFSSYGYKATSMEQIAKCAGIGKGTVYTVFSSKEELFQSILKNMVFQMIQIAKEKMEEGQTFFEGVHLTILSFLDYKQNQSLLFKIVQEAKEYGTSIVKEEIKKMDGAFLSFIQEELEKAIQKKEVKDCDTKLTAFVIFKMYIALLVEWEKEHDLLPKEQVLAFLYDYIRKWLGV